MLLTMFALCVAWSVFDLSTLWGELFTPNVAVAQLAGNYVSSNNATGAAYPGSAEYGTPAWTRMATTDARYRAGIPGPAHEPIIASRPASWPGAMPPDDEPRIPNRDDVRRAKAEAAAAAEVQQVAYAQPGVAVPYSVPPAAPYATAAPPPGGAPAAVVPYGPAPYQPPPAGVPLAPQVPLAPEAMTAPVGPIGNVPYAAQTPIDAGLGMTSVPGATSAPLVADQLVPADARELEGAAILARVGTEVVLASEVALHVNDALVSNLDKIPPEYIEPMRERLTRQRLEVLIDTKAIIVEIRRKIPAENLKKIEGSLSDEFDKHELQRRLDRAKVQTRAQLDAKYRALGTSLEREKRAFMETTLAQQWVQQQINRDFEISHDEMLAYYYDHIAEYEFAAQARWEQISVRHQRGKRKAEAYAKIAELGNRVLRGEPFAEVAKSGSDGATADDGGARDWTNVGSLASKPLDQAIFSLPVGTLSSILEDDDFFHIVRVVERKEAGRTPFTETQAEIREKIKAERIQGQATDFVDGVRESVRVTTVFDHLPPLDERVTARPNSETSSR